MRIEQHQRLCNQLLDIKKKIDKTFDDCLIFDSCIDRKLKTDLLKVSIDISGYLLYIKDK